MKIKIKQQNNQRFALSKDQRNLTGPRPAQWCGRSSLYIRYISNLVIRSIEMRRMKVVIVFELTWSFAVLTTMVFFPLNVISEDLFPARGINLNWWTRNSGHATRSSNPGQQDVFPPGPRAFFTSFTYTKFTCLHTRLSITCITKFLVRTVLVVRRHTRWATHKKKRN